MRETRLSGSEGGGNGTTRSSLPLSKVPSAQPYRGDHRWPVLGDR